MSKIVLAQINTFLGDVSGNTQKILDYINRAKNDSVDMIVFSESSILGNGVIDILKRNKYMYDLQMTSLSKIADLAQNIKVILGFIKRSDKDNNVFYNAAAVMYNGRIMKTIDESNQLYITEKSALSLFIAGAFSNIVQIGDKKYSLCFNNNIEDTSFYESLLRNKPDGIINISSMPSRTGLEFNKNRFFSSIAKYNKVSFISVNKVGYSDNFCYDGLSRMYDSNGNVVARAKYLEEDYLVIENGSGSVYYMPDGMDKDFCLFYYSSDLERTYKNIVFSIKEYFSKNGFSKAVLGLSGGLDSSVSAVLLADALGKDNVLGVSMPSKITSSESKNDAKQLAENLGIKFIEIPLPNLLEPVKTVLSDNFNSLDFEKYDKSTTIENLQARTRATLLWSISNEFKGMLPIATSDKSEAYIGYATVNGDMSGGFAPIADVTKTKLFALADYLNKNREVKNVIPQAVLEKPPGAELKINPKTGKTVCAEEDNMPYEFLDEIIWLVENYGFGYDKLINHNYHYEINNPISLEQKTDWVKKYFWKSKCAVYKWHIMPASVIIDKHSIISPDYYQPILSKLN